MTRSPKITLVGAGGMSFGPAMVNDVVHTPELRGARLMLHDVNAERLQRAYQFAAKLNASAGAPLLLDASTDPGEALDGADFVLSSAEFGRFEFWKQDYEIPNRHGARQINGENGGPGAVFHSLRSIKNTLSICESIEKYSPGAFLINLTNPMSRVTLAIDRATSVRNVGMCHEMPMGIYRLARRLRIPRKHIEAKASGINHFTFFTEFRDRRTGEDLLPRIRAFFAKPVFDYSPRTVRAAKVIDRALPGATFLEFNYSPLVVHMVREYGLVPCSVDSHIGEYVPFALDVAEWMPRPLDFHEPIMVVLERAASWAATTKVPLPLHLAGHSHEEVVDIIAAMWTDTPAWIMATNVPNKGYLPDVAEGAIVEVGATVDGEGIHPDQMPPAAGGHWHDAYPFVQLHQASVFYGVASTVLGTGAVQQQGPEQGLQERARRSEIQSYYDDILYRRFVGSGRVTFLGSSEYQTDGATHRVTSRVSGEATEVDVRRRVVDATYLSPTIPATTPPPFGVADPARVVAVNELPALPEAPGSYVMVGSGKTATDAIVWLLANGVQPDRIMWVRPRDPWMLNRAVVQPDPAVAVQLAADTMGAAADAGSLDELFLRLEDAGVVFRIDTAVTPTMAKAPTLGVWELELLRTIENVVRLGHIKEVAAGEIVLDDGVVPLAPGSVVVHCAASGLQYPPLVPLWGPDKIRLQTVRSGFPCFNAALTGYVEATRGDDRERNRLCPPNTLPDTPASWARMQVRHALATRAFGAEPDIAAWADGCALNPARMQPGQRDEPAVQAASARLAAVAERGLTRMAELADEPLSDGAEG